MGPGVAGLEEEGPGCPRSKLRNQTQEARQPPWGGGIPILGCLEEGVGGPEVGLESLRKLEGTESLELPKASFSY